MATGSRVLVPQDQADGMRTVSTHVDSGFIAPSYDDIVILKRNSNHFPLYEDLAGDLLKVQEHPERTSAHVLGTLAGYAYAEGDDTIARMASRMGLGKCHVREIRESIDGMLIESTAYVIQSEDGRVAIVCYRGTQPANVVNWLLNAEIYPETIGVSVANTPGKFDVHAGFYRNMCATQHEVMEALLRAMQRQSILDGVAGVANPLEAVYLAGHSLGGAMATLMAIQLKGNSDYRCIADKLKGVYTFGQPMVGSLQLAKHCNEDPFLGKNVVRYVYKRDIVPALPPTMSGGFAHFGKEQHYDGFNWDNTSDQPVTQIRGILQPLEVALGFTVEPMFRLVGRYNLARNVGELIRHRGVNLHRTQFLPFTRSIEDHIPDNYIDAITPAELASTVC